MQRDSTHMWRCVGRYVLGGIRVEGYDTPSPPLPHIAYDFLFVKLWRPHNPFHVPLPCFSWLVKLCAPGQMCKDNPVTLSTSRPSNSRDLHHMAPVTNQLYAACPYSRNNLNLT